MKRFFFLSGGWISVYFFIKERGAEILEKSTCPPFCESPLKIPRNLVQLLALGCQRGHEIHRAIGIEKTWCIHRLVTKIAEH
jgi:hypothetical protein